MISTDGTVKAAWGTRVSYSSLTEYRTCPRKYYYSHKLGRVPMTDAAALSFGKAWHILLEEYWKNGKDAAVEKLKAEGGADMDEADNAKLSALIRCYNPPRDLYEVEAVEQSFELVVPRLGKLVGRADCILREKQDGKKYILEHKTTSMDIVGFGPFWQKIEVDAQQGIYCKAFDCAGIIYDTVRKPLLKLAKEDAGSYDNLAKRIEAAIEEEREKYFQFRTFPRREEEIETVMLDVEATMSSMKKHGEYYQRHSNSCVTFGSCPYLKVCTGQALIGDDAQFRDKVKK